MVSINRKPEFGEENILIEDFILLDYNTNKDSLYLNFVGTDEGRKKVIVYKYKDKFKYEKTSFTYENDLPIHNIISCDFFSRKSIDYLLICKYKNKYVNKLIYEQNGKVMSKDIGESRALPMLICYKTCRPSLLVQTENKTQIWTFPKLNLSLNPEIVEVDLPKLHPQHTSAYLPLDSSYAPVLALDSLENGKRALQIFKFDGKVGKFVKKGVLDLPDKIGNLVFADLNNDTVADLAFISEKNSKFYLNIILNTENFGSCTKKIEREISRKCVLEENEMPTGLYPVDLYSNSKIQLALKIKDEKYKYVLIENDTWNIKEEVFDFNYEQLYSISFADLSEIGREGLVLNYKKNNKPVLSFRKNGLLLEDCYSVSVLSYDGYAPEKSFCSSSVGMTYRYNFLEKTKKGVGFQRPQTSYMTLKPPVLFLGIGTSPFLISFEGIGGPFINESRPFNIDIEIIPNSKLVMSPRDGKYCKLILVLSTKQNLFYVFLIYFIVFIITVITIFYLHIKEVKKRKKARKEEAIFFNFDAL